MDMRSCPYCGGDGKDKTHWDDICVFCGGFGLIECEPPNEDNEETEEW